MYKIADKLAKEASKVCWKRNLGVLEKLHWQPKEMKYKKKDFILISTQQCTSLNAVQAG